MVTKSRIQTLSDYYTKHSIQSTLTSMLVDVGKALPDDPVAHMIGYLTKMKLEMQHESIQQNAPLGQENRLSESCATAPALLEESPLDDETKNGPLCAEIFDSPSSNSLIPPDAAISPPFIESQQKKPVEDMLFLLHHIQKNPLFKELAIREQDILIAAFFRRDYETNELITVQGEVGSKFYVLQKGICECNFHRSIDVIEQHVVVESTLSKREIYKDTSFGELSLIFDSPTSATIFAKEAVTTWALDKQTFREALNWSAACPGIPRFEVVDQLSLFGTMTRFDKLGLLSGMTKLSFGAGTRIIQEGSIGTALYEIVEGEVKCVKSIPGKGEVECFERLVSGAYFGEVALLRDQLRGASLDAVTDVVVYSVDLVTFKQLPDSVHCLLKKNSERYENFPIATTPDMAIDQVFEKPLSPRCGSIKSEKSRHFGDGQDLPAKILSHDDAANRNSFAEEQDIPAKSLQHGDVANGNSSEKTQGIPAKCMPHGDATNEPVRSVVEIPPNSSHQDKIQISITQYEEVIMAAFRSSTLFIDCPTTALETLMLKMVAKVYMKDDIVFKEGDDADCWYAIAEGNFEVFVKLLNAHSAICDIGANELGVLVNIVQPKMGFGDVSITFGCPRTATIRARERSIIFSLRRTDCLSVYEHSNLSICALALQSVRQLDIVPYILKMALLMKLAPMV